MSQTTPIKDEVLKSYIDQIFSRYNTNLTNVLNPTQVTGFFNDLFRSLNIAMVLSPQQSVDTIKAIYPAYTGLISREELTYVFKILLNINPSQQLQVTTPPVNQPINNLGYSNGSYINMPNYINVNINNGFTPQPGYILNPNMVRPNQTTYPNNYMQGFNGYQNANQFNNFRRQ